MHRGIGATLDLLLCFLLISAANAASTRAAKNFLRSEEDVADRELSSLTSDSETVVDHDTYSAITGIAPELSLLLDSRASHALHAEPRTPDVPVPVQEPEDVDVDGMGGAAVEAEKDALKETEKGAKIAAQDSNKAVKENQHKADIDKDVEEDAKTAAQLTGVKPNKHGDTGTFKVTCFLNTGIVLLVATVFSVLRKSSMFRMAFCGNVYCTGPPVSARADGGKQEGEDSMSLEQPDSPSGRISFAAPPDSPEKATDAGAELSDPTENTGMFGWILPSFRHDVDDTARREGLDAALVLGFCDLGMDILGTIGLPMVCIMCPLHYYYGGDAAEDQLSSIAMGNVINKHPWMYMVHALIVLAVTRTVVLKVFAAMDKLLSRRYYWLKQLPAPRCKTVLVQNIPEEWRSDEKLLEFFQKVFPNKVSSAKIVKDAPELQARFEEEEYNKASLRSDLQTLEEEDLKKKAKSLGATEEEVNEASSHSDKKGPLIHLIIESIVKKSKNPDIEASMDRASTVSDKVHQIADSTCVGCRKNDDRIAFYEKEITRLEPQVYSLRIAAIREAGFVGGINVASGFVTFNDRREAEICHTLTMSKDLSEWRISKPPPASDVRYDDLKPPDHSVTAYKLFGMFLVGLLYIVYLPITCLGANLEHVVDFGIFQPIWASFAPGLALMLFLSFLPTVFLLIFRSFFFLVSDTFAQHTLQIYYTYFLIFFVILVTIIGRSLLQTLANVAREPELIFELMATQMPKATHFYMDFLMIQWWDEAKALLRPFVTFKYFVFSTMFAYSQEDSRELAEPEDQDFDGIGARTSHLLICLLVGLVFSTLSPLIAILGFVFFAIARVVYGYLIIYAETRKPDLGGVFYHKQLQILLEGLMIYNCLMIGVLMFRARTKLPMLIAFPGLIYTYIQYKRFRNDFVWQSLPLDEVCLDKLKKPKDNGLRYYQAELQAEYIKDGADPEAEKALFLQRVSTRNLVGGIGGLDTVDTVV